MSDKIDDDLHDRLLKAVFEYCRWSERFEIYGYKESAQAARSSLTEVMQIAKKRRAEIHQRRIELHGPKKYYGVQAKHNKTKTEPGNEGQ